MMNTEKRLMLAVAFSVIIIIAYQAYMRQFVKPHHGVDSSDTILKTQETMQAVSEQDLTHVPTSRNQTVSYDTVASMNNSMQISTTNYGGTINEIFLVDYYDKDGQPYPLVVESATHPQLFETVFIHDNLPSKWQLDSHTEYMVRYKAARNGLEVSKTITLDRVGYAISLDIELTNTTTAHKTIQYTINNGYLETARGHMDSRYLGADILVDGKIIRKRPSNKTIQDGESIPGSPAWVSTRGRYFSFLLKPGQEMQSAFVKSLGKTDLYTGLVSRPISLMPHTTVQHTFTIYAGPNNTEAMMALDPTAKEIINYGIFHGIGRLLFNSLQMLYRWTHNYGVAIILLSLVISLIMLPLTRKSLHSMKEMQKIQPETELIRKQYSTNPQKMNKEIMELYKKHKINPVGGCLPMLLQIPIFFSLYQVLLRSVELKGSPFLWIKDLAEPDAAFALPSALQNLPVLGGHINILPVLMAVAMAFQQRLSQGGGKQMSEQQRLMAGIMPIMFGFIFYNMPSGLVLYWFTNTLFMLVIQEVVLKSRVLAQSV